MHEDPRVQILSTLVIIDTWGAIFNPHILKAETPIKGRADRCKKKIRWFDELIRTPVGNLLGGTEPRHSTQSGRGTTEARHRTRYRWMDKRADEWADG